jgi:hypothetical protein
VQAAWRSRILEIEGNAAALERLEDIVRSGAGFAFVGAGASAGIYPLWRELYVAMAEEAGARGLAGEGERRRWDEAFGPSPQTVLEEVRSLLGEGSYRSVLRSAFRPKAGFDGNRFSPLHGAIAELRFRGVVTTNYDPGLLEARRQLLPEQLDTGYATWLDDEGLRVWRNDPAGASSTRILFAHGIYERPNTVVLTTSEYRRAYEDGPYPRLLEELVTQDRMIYVGVSFADPFFEQVVSSALSQRRDGAAGQPRHVALIPLREPYSPALRDRYRRSYDVDALFYAVQSRTVPGGKEEDHSDVLLALKSVIPLRGSRGAAAAPQEALGRAEAVPERGALEGGSTDVFAGRADALDWLDDAAADASVRVASIVGMGGIGKTALAAYWIRKRRGTMARPCSAVLYWTFNERRNTAALLDAIGELASGGGETDRLKATEILQTQPLLLVLDGIERLQSTGEADAGALLDEDLRRLLLAAARPSCNSFVLVTSRVPLTGLEPMLGSSVRERELSGLSDEDGGEVLQLLGCGAPKETRTEASRLLRGNPLALRIFADALSRAADSDPADIMRRIEEEGGSEAGRLRSLLSYYERALAPSERAILSGIALLDTAPIDIAVKLVRELAATKPLMEARTTADIEAEIESLVRREVVYRSTGYLATPLVSCHPMIREHFRSSLLQHPETAVDAVAALRFRPDDFHPMGPDDRSVCLALLDGLIAVGDMRHAESLYAARFEEDFASQDEPGLQLRTMISFVATEERRSACAEQLSKGQLASYLSSVVVLALGAGRLGTAARYGELYAAAGDRGQDNGNEGVALANWAVVALHAGDLEAAEDRAQSAIGKLEGAAQPDDLCLALSIRAYAQALSGRLREARAGFEEALRRWAEYEPPFYPEWGALGFCLKGRNPEGYAGIMLADAMRRCGQSGPAKAILTENLGMCEHNQWALQAARCEWLLGWIELDAGALDAAETRIGAAAGRLREQKAGLDLGWMLVSLAGAHRRRGNWDAALAAISDAAGEMGGREKPLQYADALTERGRILLERACAGETKDRFDLTRAFNDGKSALTLARERHYAWAERDAMRLMAAARDADGAASEAREWRQRADAVDPLMASM